MADNDNGSGGGMHPGIESPIHLDGFICDRFYLLKIAYVCDYIGCLTARALNSFYQGC